ncbi:imidazole glycerol phosphate synthase subunit HisH [Candidatus Vidania fulgoroideorum]
MFWKYFKKHFFNKKMFFINQMVIGIISIGTGNIFSIFKVLKNITNNKILLINNYKKLKKCNKIIFPGQGSIKNYFNNLKNIDLLYGLNKIIYKIYFLGICLGKQIVFGFNKEGNFNGLGIIKGNVSSYNTYNIFTPFIGWNKIQILFHHFLWKGIKNGSFFYFSNSFYVKNKNTYSSISYINKYFSSSFIYKNIFLVQFHPEISSFQGIKMLNNFINWK